MMQSLNNDQVPNPNEKYQIGDEIEVKVHSIPSDNGLILTYPAQAPQVIKTKAPGSSKLDVASLT